MENKSGYIRSPGSAHPVPTPAAPGPMEISFILSTRRLHRDAWRPGRTRLGPKATAHKLTAASRREGGVLLPVPLPMETGGDERMSAHTSLPFPGICRHGNEDEHTQRKMCDLQASAALVCHPSSSHSLSSSYRSTSHLLHLSFSFSSTRPLPPPSLLFSSSGSIISSCLPAFVIVFVSGRRWGSGPPPAALPAVSAR